MRFRTPGTSQPDLSATPVKQARQALGARLREIRRDAGLTGRALASACEWHFTKVSKLEHGTQNPSEEDIRVWCHVCRADDQVPELIATVRAIESMYIEWQRHMRAGLKRSQTSSVPLYERTRLFRGYEDTVIPGLFHTAEYAAAILAFWNSVADVEYLLPLQPRRADPLHPRWRRRHHARST